MHFNLYHILQAALLVTAVLAMPVDVSSQTNHGLMKRHFWCNGVDSETICPEGQTMVPIDEYACDAITSAGRLSQISAPVNGETSTTCQQANPPTTPSSTSITPATTSTTPVGTGSLESRPVLSDEKLKAAPVTNATAAMHLTCTEVDGWSGSSVLLNCTTRA